MKQLQNLKLIALLLPGSLSEEVKKEQLFISITWGSKHALRTPPHITIIPPLSVTDTEEKSLLTIAEKISENIQPFTLHLDGYRSFKPKVVFMHVETSPELNDLQVVWRKELLSTMPHVLDQYPERPYHPHITLAHRDVTPEQFKKIWTHYAEQKFSTSFEVKSFCILKHNQNGWGPDREFDLV